MAQMAMRLADGNDQDDGRTELRAGIEVRATSVWLCDCGAICSDDHERCGRCGAWRDGVRGLIGG